MNTYDIYSFRDYKRAIRERVEVLKEDKKTFTLKYLAKKIPLQYTYLSMLLNKPEQHVSENQLYRMGQVLDFVTDEVDFLLLLRSLATAHDPKYRNHVAARVEQIASEKTLRANHEFIKKHNADIDYLLNPLAVLVGNALDIPEYQKSPLKLCSALGINQAQLKTLLETLERLEFITIDDGGKVSVKNASAIHIGKDHPLMRSHQIILKNSLIHRLAQTNETNKESFFATFTMDEEGFAKVRNLFKKFIQEVQTIQAKSSMDHLYQLNFDFLRWL